MVQLSKKQIEKVNYKTKELANVIGTGTGILSFIISLVLIGNYINVDELDIPIRLLCALGLLFSTIAIGILSGFITSEFYKPLAKEHYVVKELLNE